MTTAEILHSRKNKLIDNWIERLKNELPIINEHDSSAIQNDVPLLLEAIVDNLATSENKKIVMHSRQHGFQRTKFKEYSLHHIIREYNILKSEILLLLDEHEDVGVKERNIILESIDQAVEQAAEVYHRLKQGVQINARKVAEKKASDLELEDHNREEFIHAISHDLNNPLSNIKACIDLLEKNLAVGQVSQVLRILKSSTDQAQGLIKDFLDVGKISAAEKLPVMKRKVEIVEDLRNEIQVYLVSHESNIKLSSNQETIYADLDMDLVRRAFNNLINNALKHGDSNAVIDVMCNTKGGKTEVSVQNDGKVIPEDILDNIFNRYYQADGSRKGWGLGLAFVKEVVDAHGGEVDVKSNSSEGTKFTMTFPVS